MTNPDPNTPSQSQISPNIPPVPPDQTPPVPNTPSQSDIRREDKILYIAFTILMVAVLYIGIVTHQDEFTLLNTVLGIVGVLLSIGTFYGINTLLINKVINWMTIRRPQISLITLLPLKTGGERHKNAPYSLNRASNG